VAAEMRRFVVLGVFVVALTGCQYGYRGQFWTPAPDASGYGTWAHEPAVANGCNEWDTEPTAEVDNDGQPCQTLIP
jgi:hypothetical protein